VLLLPIAQAEQTAKLSYEQFRRLFGMVEEFVAHTDATVPRSTPGLKGELVSMAKAWLNQYHRKKKNQLQVRLDVKNSLNFGWLVLLPWIL
jgi:hypothetical protein